MIKIKQNEVYKNRKTKLILFIINNDFISKLRAKDYNNKILNDLRDGNQAYLETIAYLLKTDNPMDAMYVLNRPFRFKIFEDKIYSFSVSTLKYVMYKDDLRKLKLDVINSIIIIHFLMTQAKRYGDKMCYLAIAKKLRISSSVVKKLHQVIINR